MVHLTHNSADFFSIIRNSDEAVPMNTTGESRKSIGRGRDNVWPKATNILLHVWCVTYIANCMGLGPPHAPPLRFSTGIHFRTIWSIFHNEGRRDMRFSQVDLLLIKLVNRQV